MKHKKLALAIKLAAMAGTFYAGGAMAHGYNESPQARATTCASSIWHNPQGSGCQALAANGETHMVTDKSGNNWIHANWQSYANPDIGLKNGKICSANKANSKLDLPSSNWKATAIKPDSAGQIDLHYRFTAHHRNDHFAYYITKPGFDPSKELTWDDLELMGKWNNVPPTTDYHKSVKLPSDQRGRHVIVSAWPVSAAHGTRETFITCSDVDIQGASISSWQTIGDGLTASSSLKAGSEVTFRLFMSNGQTFGDIKFILAQAMSPEEWIKALADKVNAQSGFPVKIGELVEGNIVAGAGKISYQVYSKQQVTKYTYAMDIKAAGGGDGTGGDSSAVADAGKDQQRIQGSAKQNVPLDGSASKEAQSYLWEIVSGDFALNNPKKARAQAVIPANATGETVYRLTVTDKNGKKHSDTVTVKAVKTSAAIEGVNTSDVGTPLKLTASANFKGNAEQPLKFQWTVEDYKGRQVQQGKNKTLNLNNNGKLPMGNYFVSLTVSSELLGRSASTSSIVHLTSSDQTSVLDRIEIELGVVKERDFMSYTAGIALGDEPAWGFIDHTWELPSQAVNIFDDFDIMFDIPRTDNVQNIPIKVTVESKGVKRVITKIITVPAKLRKDS